MLVTFLVYIFGMILIGFLAWRSTKNFDDYILGGRSLCPMVTALSAGASDMSGWLLMGLPGAIFISGISASWIAIVAGVWNIFAPDFGGMNSPTVLGALIPSVMLIIDGVIICPESVRVINIPKRVRDRWVFRILRLEKAAGPATILIAVLHAAFSDALLF